MISYQEHITPEPGSSISLLNRRLDDGIPFQWHHHPQFEFTLTLNSRGQRFVGDHVDKYDDGDLVLLGPNLPHTWFSSEKIGQGPHVALVVWFEADWAERIAQDFREFSRIGKLLTRAGRGLHFSRPAADGVRDRFLTLFTLNPAQRLLRLLEILGELTARSAESLSSHSPLVAEAADARDRIHRVLTYLHQNYSRTVTLAELAEIACLSESGTHRMFWKHTRKTITAYIAHMRIGEACSRLLGTEDSVGFIGDAVGYASLANFHRQFRALRGMSPREYRNQFTERAPIA
jgi:AraC-like DNA-binding protein/quercetin dioxygenase-like cupin family protein